MARHVAHETDWAHSGGTTATRQRCGPTSVVLCANRTVWSYIKASTISVNFIPPLPTRIGSSPTSNPNLPPAYTSFAMSSSAEVEDQPPRSVSRVSSISDVSLSELDIDPNSRAATPWAHYLSSPELPGQKSNREDDQVQVDRAQDATADYAERESSQVYVVFWTVERRKGPDSEQPRNPRWFLAWEVGPESKDSSEWTKLCVLELRDLDGAYSYSGAVLRDEKLGKKYSVRLGELAFEDRVKLEEVARRTPVQGMNDQGWVKELLNTAVAEGIFFPDIVQDALKHAEDGSHPLRRDLVESRRSFHNSAEGSESWLRITYESYLEQ
ncbi:hypothetical protein PHLGIDRAFT_380359 [Phlebiopsis gigantea 11061_1 CR5-6]|uniref:Uncharacterized protein n=1 Tax=Phlebiopsis gigantea (strain 11061_1 CR5-6) TaxID=745531 RepID=A0A0C3S0H3_PHLG1|nr:hypothetical protein PHLGIDRAFT_380359 [Phlebiopsis gigantea 11061_1 CR5-6]